MRRRGGVEVGSGSESSISSMESQSFSGAFDLRERGEVMGSVLVVRRLRFTGSSPVCEIESEAGSGFLRGRPRGRLAGSNEVVGLS